MSPRVEQNLSQLLHEAFVSLRTLGKRSILALLGIVIGSSSVVALINIGHNAAVDAAMIFKDMGTDTLVVQFPSKGSSNVPMRTQLDLQAVREAVPGIAYIGALTLFSGPIVFHGRTVNANFVGSTADIPPAMRLVLRQGRFRRASMPTKPMVSSVTSWPRRWAHPVSRCRWATACVSTTTCSWWWASCNNRAARC